MASDNQNKVAMNIINEASLYLSHDDVERFMMCGCLFCRMHIVATVLIMLEARGYKVTKVGDINGG
jgi:hypothetical protein